MELQPGAYFKVGKEGFEFVGTSKSPEDPSKIKVVARMGPDAPAREGALHKMFDPATLQKDGVRVGPFGEAYPYSSYVSEKTSWQALSGESLDVPHPPQLLVDKLKYAKEQGITSLEAHFLPQAQFASDGIQIGKKKIPYPENWKAPEQWFFDNMNPTPATRTEAAKPPNISPDAVNLPGKWVLVDNTQKPDYDQGNQMYPNDPFKPIIEQLAAENKITPSTPGSRFNISFNERQEHFDPALTRVLDLEEAVKKGKARVTVATEAMFNALGNMFHPEWGQTSTYEWLEDKFGGGSRLVGGLSGLGGLSFVNLKWAGPHDGHLGFRPLVVFS